MLFSPGLEVGRTCVFFDAGVFGPDLAVLPLLVAEPLAQPCHGERQPGGGAGPAGDPGPELRGAPRRGDVSAQRHRGPQAQPTWALPWPQVGWHPPRLPAPWRVKWFFAFCLFFS